MFHNDWTLQGHDAPPLSPCLDLAKTHDAKLNRLSCVYRRKRTGSEPEEP